MSYLIETLTHILSTLTEKQTPEEKKVLDRQRSLEQKVIHKAAVKAYTDAVGNYPQARHYASEEEFEAARNDYNERSRVFWKTDPLFHHGRAENRAARKELYRRITNPTPEEQEQDNIALAKQKVINRERAKKLASLENAYKEREKQKRIAKRIAQRDEEKERYNALSPREKRIADYAKEFERDPVKAASTPIRRAKTSDPRVTQGIGETLWRRLAAPARRAMDLTSKSVKNHQVLQLVAG